MNISEFRKQYPQYNHVSDIDLANKLHEKHYSHVPQEQFYEKFGIQPELKGLKGVGQDIWEGAKAVPGNLWEMAKELPGEAYGAGQQLLTDPKRVGQNALAGLAEGGKGILNTPANISDYLVKKDIIPEKYGFKERLPDYNYAEMLGREGKKPGDAIIHGLMENLPYLLGGEAGLAKGLGRTAQRAGAMGLGAIGQNENPITAALSVGAADLTPRGIVKGIKEGYKGAQKLSKATITNEVIGDALATSEKYHKMYEGIKKGASESGVTNVIPENAKNVGKISEYFEKNAGRQNKKINPYLAKDLNYDVLKGGLKSKYLGSFKDYLKTGSFEDSLKATSDLGKEIRRLEKAQSLSGVEIKALDQATKTRAKLKKALHDSLKNSERPELSKALQEADYGYKTEAIPYLENKSISKYLQTAEKHKLAGEKGNIKPAQKKLVEGLHNDTDFQAMKGNLYPKIGVNQFLPGLFKTIAPSVIGTSLAKALL